MMRSRLAALLSGLPVLLAGATAPGADAPAPVDRPPCVEVEIGSDRAAGLDCLNRLFADQVDRQHETPHVEAPVDATSPSNIVGTANRAAAEEKMGNQFGISATPQRSSPLWVSPLLPPPTGH